MCVCVSVSVSLCVCVCVCVCGLCVHLTLVSFFISRMTVPTTVGEIGLGRTGLDGLDGVATGEVKMTGLSHRMAMPFSTSNEDQGGLARHFAGRLV